MLALLSIWLGFGSLGMSVAMLFHRPWFSDGSITVALYSAAAAMCLAGLNLWSLRKRDASEAGVAMQRRQCKLAVVFALIGAGIVYGLVMAAEGVPVTPTAESSVALYSRDRGTVRDGADIVSAGAAAPLRVG